VGIRTPLYMKGGRIKRGSLIPSEKGKEEEILGSSDKRTFGQTKKVEWDGGVLRKKPSPLRRKIFKRGEFHIEGEKRTVSKKREAGKAAS